MLCYKATDSATCDADLPGGWCVSQRPASSSGAIIRGLGGERPSSAAAGPAAGGAAARPDHGDLYLEFYYHTVSKARSPACMLAKSPPPTRDEGARS